MGKINICLFQQRYYLIDVENCIKISVVCHVSLPLMNGFNKTYAAIFPRRLYFLRAFHFINLIKTKNEINE